MTGLSDVSKYFKVQLLANYHSQNTGAEMLVSDIIIVMTKRKKEIWHKHIEDNPQIFIEGRWRDDVCYYDTLYNSQQPIWERVLLVLFGSHDQIHQ